MSLYIDNEKKVIGNFSFSFKKLKFEMVFMVVVQMMIATSKLNFKDDVCDGENDNTVHLMAMLVLSRVTSFQFITSSTVNLFFTYYSPFSEE